MDEGQRDRQPRSLGAVLRRAGRQSRNAFNVNPLLLFGYSLPDQSLVAVERWTQPTSTRCPMQSRCRRKSHRKILRSQEDGQANQFNLGLMGKPWRQQHKRSCAIQEIQHPKSVASKRASKKYKPMLPLTSSQSKNFGPMPS